MANRSSFNTTLPRNIKRLVDLSPTPPPFFSKKVMVDAFLKDGSKVQRAVVQPDYHNMLRDLFRDAHIDHKAFKAKRLERERVMDEPKKDVENSVAEVV